jgi:hypothetical protein
MDPTFLTTEKKINEKVSVTSFKKGMISSVNVQAWTADVLVIGDYQTVLKDVKLSSSILIVPTIGQYCRIDVFDVNNPTDMVVAYVYGKPSIDASAISATVTYVKTINFGSSTYTTGTIEINNGIVTAVT